MNPPKMIVKALCCAGLVICNLQTVMARSLDDAVGVIADNVQKYLKHENINEVKTEVTGADDANKQLIEVKIRESLQSKGLVLTSSLKKWTVRTAVGIREEGDSVPVITLTVTLVDPKGNDADNFAEEFDETPVANAGAIPASAPDNTGTVAVKDLEKKESAVQIKVDQAPETPSLQGQNIDLSSAVKEVTGNPAGTLVPVPGKASDPQKFREQQAAVLKAVKQKIATVSAQPAHVVVARPDASTGSRKSILRPEAESGFGLEIVRFAKGSSGFLPVEMENDDNLPFVSLEEGDLIHIVIYNDNPFPVGLELLIDGVNSLILAEDPGFRERGRWIIPGRQLDPLTQKPVGFRGVIKGWLTRPNNMKEFVITSAPNGIASRFGLNHKIGTIQANFFMAWDASTFEKKLAPEFSVLCNSDRFKPGESAVGAGADLQFEGTIREAVFDKGFPIATITVKHENPQTNLPPGLPGGGARNGQAALN